MLMGRFYNSIDAKNRVIIPAKFRDALKGPCVIAKGLDDCMEVYPQSVWEAEAAQLRSLPKSDPIARKYRRARLFNLESCEMDKQGRIVVPAWLLETVHVSKDLVTIGMDDHVEIWAKEVLDAQMADDDFGDFSDKYPV